MVEEDDVSSSSRSKVVVTAFAVKKTARTKPPEATHGAFEDEEEKKKKKRKASRMPLVIPLTDELAAAAVIAKAAAAQGSTPETKKTLLMAGQLPGLGEIADQGEKFRRDVSMRAEDVAAASEAYERVPIEEFGGAVLRGMGWTGPTKEDDDRFAKAAEPRQHRLGLGATPKPPEIFDKKGRLREGRSTTTKDAVRAADAAKRKWLGASREEAAKRARRRVGVGDVATTREGRCRFVQVSGDRAVVQFERSGRSETLPIDDLDRVSTQALLTNPFVIDEEKKSPNPSRANEFAKRDGWLCEGIRVRVTREGDPRFRKKARVIDVQRQAPQGGGGGGLCALLHFDDTGDIVHDVRERHLETALPKKEGGRVRAVAGPHRGKDGVLVRREKRTETVLVRLDDDHLFVSLAMDDVAEFCADSA